MTVETKVGLVVGLGFIVCFAVILSHRGRGDELSSQVAYDLLAKHRSGTQPDSTRLPDTHGIGGKANRSVRTVGSSRVSGGRPTVTPRYPKAIDETDGRSSREREGARPEGAPIDLHAGRTTLSHELVSTANDSRSAHMAGDENGNDSSDGKLPSFEQLFGGQSNRQSETPSHTLADRTQATDGPSTPTTNGAPTNNSAGQDTFTLPPTLKDAGATKSVEKQEKSPRRQEPTKRESPSKPKTLEFPMRGEPASGFKPTMDTYAVRSGDTLWRIAERSYGHATKELVRAIYEANKDVMTSPDRVVVGMEIKLPAVAGGALFAEKAAGDRSETAHSPASGRTVASKSRGAGPDDGGSTRQGVRYYQVKQGDRYTTIAERFLGSKSRWKEIYELNKDVFPEADRIRQGVRIRVPAASEEGKG